MIDSQEMDMEMFGDMDASQASIRDPPDYTQTKEFHKFVAEEKINFKPRYGYTQLKTFKPYYFNGQVVRGYAIFTLFNQVNAKDIYLRVKGYEVAGQHNRQALRNFKKTLLNTSVKVGAMSVQAMDSSLHGMTGSQLSRGNTNLMNIYGNSQNKTSLRASQSNVRAGRIEKPKVIIQEEGRRKSLHPFSPQSEQKIGAKKVDQFRSENNAETLFAAQQAVRNAKEGSTSANPKAQANDAGIKPAKSLHVGGAPPMLPTSPINGAAVTNEPVDERIGAASNIAVASHAPRLSHTHNIDMRAQSGVFKDQKMFWLSQEEILDIYEKRFMNHSLADVGQAQQQLVFLQGGIKAYSSQKNLKEGQYVIPFSFKLPENIPGTFHIKRKGTDGKEYDLRICYSVEVFLDTDLLGNDDLKECFTREHEFEVREWLFTDDEVSEDVENQQLQNKVKSLFKTQTVLQPMFQGQGRDKELMERFKKADNSKFYEQLLEYFTDRGQPIQNAPWNVEHDFSRSTNCFQRLCCRGGRGRNDEISLTAELKKPLYYRDETIELKIEVDNSRSSRSIDNIEVTLRQIIDVKTDKNSGYKHGTGKYNQEYTTVYDLAKLNLGMLQQGASSTKLKASFNIVEVVENLHKIRSQLNKNDDAELDDEESKGQAIHNALVRSTGTRSNKEFQRMLSMKFKDQFLAVNMNRKFVSRPSVTHPALHELDPITNKNLEDKVIDGLGQTLSVNGFYVSSNMVVNLTIQIAGSGGLFDKKMHTYSTDFPIFIRSRPLRKEHIADVEQLGLLPHSIRSNIDCLHSHFKFIDNPVMLPGCATAYDQLQMRREFISKML